MAPRPVPVPRPKPLPKALPKGPVASSSAAPTQGSSSHQITYDNVQDDDEMFMRNRGRDKESWAKLRKISKEKEQKKKTSTKIVETDSDSDNSTRRPKDSKSKKSDKSPLKKYQTKKKLDRLLSQEVSSSDSDDSITIQDVGNMQDNKLKRKRTETKRARSKSITPPPAIPQYQLENARQIIRNQLGGQRKSSPEAEDDYEEEDTFVLDPQLAKIAQNVKSQSELIGHTDAVDITVKWEPHPMNEYGKQQVWAFKMDRTDNFFELFENVAEEARVLIEKLVMMYRGKRIFSSVTPQTLGIWSNADFVACDAPTYDYNKKTAAERLRAEQSTKSTQPKSTKPQNTDPNVIDLADSDSDDEPDPEIEIIAKNNQSDAESQTEAGTGGGKKGEDDDQDKFKIVLRSGLTSKDIMLNVRSTTKCGAIVKAFLKKAGLAEKYPVIFAEGNVSAQKKSKSFGSATSGKIPQLRIEGEKAGNDDEIGGYDLEDGDMVEVVDL
ncbi:hypothetical protein BDP27DRAFT_1311157 [Rhodocollybia butyracea]|uniref:Rad60/SUMO-like domain-containing protein n=1 Tax=Rhodocollybia butyracea TaxID=206335 RepID=A0A9P5UFP9_9AGAR|nr:hypothetical protein BDP27DRAFT_1311157 [Rhodocollybia butyracea]